MKICLVAAALVVGCVPMTSKAAVAAELPEDILARATDQAAKACAKANAITAKNDIRTAPTEMLAKGYCVFWSGAQTTQAPASAGRLECLKASQNAGAELARRGFPIIGLCD